MSKKGYEVGGRNVFKDIGVANPEEHLVKAQLVYRIDAIMKKRHMKQTEAAACSACASLTYPKCCAASSASSRWGGSCGFW